MERELISVGVQREVIDNTNRTTHIKDILKNPSELVQVLKNVGIPADDYVEGAHTISSPKNLWGRLSENGAKRVEEIGVYVEAPERAKMLADIGRQNGGIALLYSHLIIGDILNACSYELNQKMAAA